MFTTRICVLRDRHPPRTKYNKKSLMRQENIFTIDQVNTFLLARETPRNLRRAYDKCSQAHDFPEEDRSEFSSIRLFPKGRCTTSGTGRCVARNFEDLSRQRQREGGERERDCFTVAWQRGQEPSQTKQPAATGGA